MAKKAKNRAVKRVQEQVKTNIFHYILIDLCEFNCVFGLCVVDEPEGGVRDRSGSTYQRSAQLDQLIADVAGEEDMD